MAKDNNSEKRRSPAGIILLMILLLLAGAAGFLYYSVVKAPLTLDDPEKMAASAPMSAAERFRFSAADQTAQVRLDTADIWSLILAHTDDDFLDTINKEVSAYDLSVSGCAIGIDENGLQLDMEAFYKGKRLVVKVPCSLDVSGQHLSLSPDEVKLGVISLPVKGLLSSVKLEYDLTLPVISAVTRIDFAQDAVLLTGPLEQDIRTLVPLDERLYQTAVFCESVQTIADCLLAENGYASLLNHLEGNPADAEALYRELFALAQPEVTEEYLDSRYGLTQRFFPGIDFSATAAEQTALDEERVLLMRSLEQFLNELMDDFNNKNFRLSDGEFLWKREPFHAATYGTGNYDALFERLDPDSIFLILVDAEDGFIRNTSSFYRIADENQQFTQPVDLNKTYLPGCVLYSVDGEPFLLYHAEKNTANTYSRVSKLVPLTQEDVSALRLPGKFGVWTD